MSYVAFIDGGSRGNPGPAGYGVRIEDVDGAWVDALNGALDWATCNQAEYEGLLAALRWAVRQQVSELVVYSDSMLLVLQMRGRWRVKHEGLQSLYARACQLVRQIGDVRFEHLPREENTEADRLANEAMDEARNAALNARRHTKQEHLEPGPRKVRNAEW